MDPEDRRRYERVATTVKVKLPGYTTWTESTTSNVSGGGLFFESSRQLNPGDIVTLQFMLQAKSGTLANVHFFASARVVRTISQADIYQIAVEFIIEDDVRKDLLKMVETIKSQSLAIDRPTYGDALFRKPQSQ